MHQLCERTIGFVQYLGKSSIDKKKENTSVCVSQTDGGRHISHYQYVHLFSAWKMFYIEVVGVESPSEIGV